MSESHRLHMPCRVFCTGIAFFLIFLASSLGFDKAHAAPSSLQLPIHALDGGVHLPFPTRPSLLGIVLDGESRSAAYQYTDERASFGYTATIMLDPIPSAGSLSPAEWMTISVKGILEGINGRLILEKDVIIDGRQGRYIVASMGVVDHQANSRTLIIYDDGKIHTWAMQDVPAITGDLGTRIFAENIQRIRIDSVDVESSIVPGAEGLYLLRRVLLPFPGQPEPVEVDMPPADVEALAYQPSRGGAMYVGLALTGLPRVADPAYTFLRGARFERELLESGNVNVGGEDAQYQIIKVPGSALRHTYAAAWSYADTLYVWNLHGDHGPGDTRLREEFFQSLEHIKNR